MSVHDPKESANVNITTLNRFRGRLLEPPHGTTTEVVISKLYVKGVLWKCSIQIMKKADSVLLSLFMQNNTKFQLLLKEYGLILGQQTKKILPEKGVLR